MIDFLADPHVWASFIALSAMEVVLGIDNVVFISVMISRMPPAQRLVARRVGLSLALLFRVAMLAGIIWFTHLTKPVFTAFGYDFSWRDLILIAGGLFLLWKATREIHSDIEGDADTKRLPSSTRCSPASSRLPSSISSSPSIRSSPRSAWPTMSRS
jgi:predicted tellurium resistance membrane protein TerC